MFRKLFITKTDSTRIHLFRSIFASAVSFSLDFMTLKFLVDFFAVYYLLAAAFAFIAGTTLNYFLSVKWIFKSRTIKNNRIEYIIYIIIGVIGLLLNTAAMWFFTEKIGIFYLLSKVISGASLFFFNFFLRKVVLFRRKR